MMHQILETIEADVQSRPSAIEFEMAYQARIAIDRIKFAIKHTEQFSKPCIHMREAGLQLLDALDRLESVDRRFQIRSRCAVGRNGTTSGRRQITESGFATKREAEEAEAKRRIAEQEKPEAVKAGSGDAPLPKTLAMLLPDFLAEQAEKKLAAKTVERYREQTAYLSSELLSMPIREITALHLSREWNRLQERGGHHRKTKAARPLSAKTVRNIAGVVSSAFARAIKWGLVSFNPVTHSEMPSARRKKGIALTPAQKRLLIDSAKGAWCMPAFLELSAPAGARRGEVLALRWTDVQNGEVIVSRSLSQTKRGLAFKGTKTDKERPISLPKSAISALETHRNAQNSFRKQFGTDYRADSPTGRTKGAPN